MVLSYLINILSIYASIVVLNISFHESMGHISSLLGPPFSTGTVAPCGLDGFPHRILGTLVVVQGQHLARSSRYSGTSASKNLSHHSGFHMNFIEKQTPHEKLCTGQIQIASSQGYSWIFQSSQYILSLVEPKRVVSCLMDATLLGQILDVLGIDNAGQALLAVGIVQGLRTFFTTLGGSLQIQVIVTTPQPHPQTS